MEGIYSSAGESVGPSHPAEPRRSSQGTGKGELLLYPTLSPCTCLAEIQLILFVQAYTQGTHTTASSV